jgi:hypothetical protein
MTTAVAGTVLAFLAVARVADTAPPPTPTRNATLSVAAQVNARTRTFCGHLVAFEQQIARDLNDGNGEVKTILRRLLDHVSEGFGVLADEQNRLKGTTAGDADDVLSEIGGVALWSPDDPEPGFPERVLAMVDRIDALEAVHCPPAG